MFYLLHPLTPANLCPGDTSKLIYIQRHRDIETADDFRFLVRHRLGAGAVGAGTGFHRATETAVVLVLFPFCEC